MARIFGRGYFPHQFAWLIDNPLRRLLVNPARFANSLRLRDANRILEIGPGSGYFSVELARRVPNGQLELLDLQVEMLAKAKRKLQAIATTNVSYTAADLNAGLPYRDGSFDVIVMIAVLGEVSDKPEALRSCYQGLRSGGVLAVHEHVPDPDLIKLKGVRSHFSGRLS